MSCPERTAKTVWPDNECFFTQHKSSAYEDFWERAEYALLDVNEDEDDLIPGKDGTIFSIWGIPNGKTGGIASVQKGYLCEENVLKNERYWDGRVYHWYYLPGSDGKFYRFLDVEYSSYEESWVVNTYESGSYRKTTKVVSQAHAQEVIESFTPLALQWRPIREFPIG